MIKQRLKSYSFLEQLTFLAIGVLFIIFMFFNFYNLHEYIFAMPDDYVYSAGVKDFLTTGSYHWAGSKPGVVLLGSIFGLDSPQSIIFLFATFGLLSGLALFAMGMHLFNSFYLSSIPVLLWFTSPFYFFFSKTHLLIYTFFYMVGVLLCFKGLEKGRWGLYYLGGALLGISTTCYYAIFSYLPFTFLILGIAFYKKGYSFTEFVLKTSIPCLMPILILDSFSVLTYIFWGKKNWPLIYSTWGQLSTVAGGTGHSGAFFFLGHFFQVERVWLSFLAIISFGLVIVKSVRALFTQQYMKYLYVGAFALPAVFLEARAFSGGFSVFRSFVAVMPAIYLLVAFALFVLFPKKHQVYFLWVTMLIVLPQYVNTHTSLREQQKTGYHIAGNYLQESKFDVLTYLGPRRSWEQLVSGKEIIPLNVRPDSLAFLKDEEMQGDLLDDLSKRIKENKKLGLVVTSQTVYNFEKAERIFASRFNVVKMNEFSHPYMFSDILEGGEVMSLAEKKRILAARTKVYALR